MDKFYQGETVTVPGKLNANFDEVTASLSDKANKYDGTITDFNLALTQGEYSFLNAKNGPNANSSYGKVIIIVNDGATHNNTSNWIWQIVYFTSYNIQPSQIWYRSKANNADWTAWRQLATTDSPGFTGIPTAPTAPVGTNNTQIANTKFVLDQITISTPQKTTKKINYYVNATTGLDTNDGLTNDTPFKTVQKAIDSIPQIVNDAITVNIADGTYSEDLIIPRLYGESVTIKSISANANNCILKSISIKNCAAPIAVINIKLNTTTQDAINIYTVTNAFISGCIMSDSAPLYAGVHAIASNASISACTISNKGSGIWSATARVFSNNNTGTGNTTALSCSDGGTIGKWNAQPSGTTAESSAGGGVIR